jgi:hypothetical protein
MVKEYTKDDQVKEKEIKKMQLSMKFTNFARLSVVKKKLTWWSSIDTASTMVSNMKETIRNLTPEKDARTFEGLLCLFGSNEVMDFFLPRLYQMRERQKNIDHEKKRGVVIRVPTDQEEQMVEWMHNMKETAAMLMVEDQIHRGDLTVPRSKTMVDTAIDPAMHKMITDQKKETNQKDDKGSDKGSDKETLQPPPLSSSQPVQPLPTQAKKTIFCHVMDNAGSDVICAWCHGHGSVIESRAIISADLESQQLSERLRIQVDRLKTALHMSAITMKELKKRPKRRHVNIQVDDSSIQKECGGANHHDHESDNEDDHDHQQHVEHDAAIMLEQAHQAINALKQCKLFEKENADMKRTMELQKKQLKKRANDMKIIREELEDTKIHANELKEDLKNKNSKLQIMKARQGAGVSTGGNDIDEQQQQQLQEEVVALRAQIQEMNVQHASRGLDAADWNTNDDVRMHQEHAYAVGKRLKEADMDILKLQHDVVLRDTELVKMKREVEEAMKMLALNAGSMSKNRRMISTQTDGDWTKMTATQTSGSEGEQHQAEEREKTWHWLTETHRDMVTNRDVPEVNETGNKKEMTVRDALAARKWLISKQAVMNWGVLTQTMLTMIEVNKDATYNQQRLNWMKETLQETEQERRKTTEKILSSIMNNLLMGSDDIAAYVPRNQFQPYIKNFKTFTKYKYHDGRRDGHGKRKLRSRNRKKRRHHHGYQSDDEEYNGGLGYDDDGHDAERGGQNNYQGSVPEMGSFPQRQTLFSHGSHRVTRLPLSTPFETPTSMSCLSPTENSSGKSNRLKRKTTNRPRRPATAKPSTRSTRERHPSQQHRPPPPPPHSRPKTAVAGWRPPPKWF